MQLSEQRILLTGGAGFIGSALLWDLNQKGCDSVVVCDRLGHSEKWRNLVPLKFEDYVAADDLIPALEDNAFGDFDLVLHLGACSATTEQDASYLARNNFELSKVLAVWALDHGARFVYASSAATYGNGERGMDDRDQSFEGLSRLRPLNMYGYSKHMFDLWAARNEMLDQIVGLKYFNVFGPNEAHKGDMRSLVAKALPQIRETGTLKLFRSHRDDYEDGRQERDFLWIKDATAITLHLAETSSAAGIYNVGSGVASSWLNVADALFAALGDEPDVEFIDMPIDLQPKYQYHTRANLSKLRETGFKDEMTPLDDAIWEYVREYLVPDLRLGEADG